MNAKQFLSVLIAMLMCVSIAQWASADDDLGDLGPASESSEDDAALAEQLADIAADKAAVVEDLVGRFETDENTAYQLESTLAAASVADLAKIESNADSIDDINAILGGSEGLERLGDLTEDYAYTAVTPCRIVNTNVIGGPFLPGVARSYRVFGFVGAQGGAAFCPSPNGEPRAVHINVTAVPVAGQGNFRAYPAGGAAPNASLTNYKAGVQNVANAGTIRTVFNLAGPEITVLNSFGTANLVIDVLGYYHNTEHLAGADFNSGEQNLNLAAGDTTVRAVTISAPAAGKVIVNASGYFDLADAVGIDTGRCSITTGLTVDFSHLIIARERTGNSMTFIPFGATRGFNVGPGNTTFRLVCNEFSGTVRVADSSLTAVWVPRMY